MDTASDNEVNGILQVISRLNSPELFEQPVDVVRAEMARIHQKLDMKEKPEVREITELHVPVSDGSVVGVRLYLPDSPHEVLPLLVYFHSGGYVLGDVDMLDSFTRLIARDACCCVASVEYGRAPEFKFPSPINQGLDVVCWMHANADRLGIDPARIAIGGDSSGGTISIGIARLLAKRGGPALKKVFTWYPGVGDLGDTESARAFGSGYLLTQSLQAWTWRHYLNDATELSDPLVQPILATDFDGFPPLYVMSGGLDARRDGNKQFAEKVAACGVDTVYDCAEGALHGFLFMLGAHTENGLPAARRSVEHIRQTFWPGPTS